MVEDALKVTRNLQRLLLIACAVALVFLSSLRDVDQEVELLTDLKQLPVLWSGDYGLKVETDLLAVPSREWAEFHVQLAEELGDFDPTDLESIARALAQPAHIGRMKPEALLATEEGMSLSSLRAALESLPRHRDAEIVLAGPYPLSRIAAAIRDAAPDSSVTAANVQLHLRDEPETSPFHSFLPGEKQGDRWPLILSFELQSPGRSAPIVTVPITGVRYAIDGTSWATWTYSLPIRYYGRRFGNPGGLIA